MDAEYDIFEIVKIIHNFCLIDAESYQRRYRTHHGQPLASGYYVVNWPEHIRSRRFNEHAAFHGPFNCRKEAQATLEWLHQERALTMSSDIPSVTVPNFNPIEVKTAKQRLRLVKDVKAKQRITEFPPNYPASAA